MENGHGTPRSVVTASEQGPGLCSRSRCWPARGQRLLSHEPKEALVRRGFWKREAGSILKVSPPGAAAISGIPRILVPPMSSAMVLLISSWCAVDEESRELGHHRTSFLLYQSKWHGFPRTSSAA